MDQLANEVIWLSEVIEKGDTKVCHTMDQRRTTEEVDQKDKVWHRVQG
jgi:hypothetical protein